jgi:hypothetical protein
MNSLHAFGCRARRATQRGNVFRCEAKAKELLIIDIAELRSDALLRRVVFRQNEPPHQARSSDLAPCGGYGDALLQTIGSFEMPLGDCGISPRAIETLSGYYLWPPNVADQPDVAKQPGHDDRRIKPDANVNRKKRNK